MLSSPASPAMQAMPILSVAGLSKRFGGLVALADYDLRLAAGTIHGVIGPNGAGKTTLFNLLSRMVAPTSGSIEFDGQDITHLPSDRVARMGITRTFQNIRLFDDLTVLDNVKVGVQAHHPEHFVATLLSRPSFRSREVEIEARARELLARVGLASSASRTASSLPYGDQRRLEIARALAVEPRILMLDEPNAGMNQVETEALLGLVRRIRDELGVTIILIAHDIPLVMNLCDRIQVLNFGELIAEGKPQEVRADPEVVAAYIGQPKDA
ncbi:MAG TPA: ABC transporter ATP-binding protein [Candidatus Limnocylindrales bacterium]|nr:ABC transporter ATP-binding protein [Candidatus Limnocylindrales bacterium]